MSFDIIQRTAAQRLQTQLNMQSMYAKPELQKSEDSDDLIKGGEGSRGGKVIGHTDSGKPIYDKHSNVAHIDFDSYDHSDARDIHVNKMQELDKKKDSEGYLNDQNDKKNYDNHWKEMAHHNELSRKLRKKELK